jgi:hypothetical protein
VAGLSVEVWLAMLAVIAAAGYPTLAAEREPPWTLLVLSGGLVVAIAVLLAVSKPDLSAKPPPAGAPLAAAALAGANEADAQQLAIDINGFLDERQISARWGTRRYDAETVHGYHQRFATRLVKLGNDLQAAGTPPERVSPLLDRQDSVVKIEQVTRYLKYREWRDGAGSPGVGPVS